MYTEIVTPKEAKEICPILRTDDIEVCNTCQWHDWGEPGREIHEYVNPI